MFEFLKNIFTSNTIPSIPFVQFYEKLTKLKQMNIYPYDYNLPLAISLPVEFWQDIVGIHKQTLNDGLEREIALFWVDGEIITTSVVKGNDSSVTSNHSVNVRYVPHPTKREYFRKEILLDGKIFKRKEVYYKNMPKKIVVEYLFNLHTHPRHTMENGNTLFSFVSKQDIISMLASKAIVTGLVTDKLWLFVRTDKTPGSIKMEEKDITVESLKSVMNIVTYDANFFKKAIKK